jgi:hypothetical protein
VRRRRRTGHRKVYVAGAIVAVLAWMVTDGEGRYNIVDLRRQGMFDVYNLFNAGTVLGRERHVRPGLAAADEHSGRAGVQARRQAGFLIWDDPNRLLDAR